MKIGKYIPLGTYNNVKIGYGTVDFKNLKTIYLKLNSWLQPENETDDFDYLISKSRRKIKEIGLSETRINIAKTWFVDHLAGDGYKLCLDEGAKATTQAALASLDAWDCWDGRGQLNQITSPTLILWSNKDRSYDWNQQEVLNKGIANSKVEIVDGCAHNSHMEKPDLINLIIKNFLT